MRDRWKWPHWLDLESKKVIYLTLIWLFQIWSGDHHLLIKGKTYESIADSNQGFLFISTMHVICIRSGWISYNGCCFVALHWHLLKRSLGTLFWWPLHWGKAGREKLLEYLYHRDNKVSDENERGSVHRKLLVALHFTPIKQGKQNKYMWSRSQALKLC